ncbi:sensor histidine kinase [Niabella aquatica]
MKLIVFLFTFLVLSGHAQVIDLNQNEPEKNLGKSIMYFEDKSAGLSLQEVQEQYAAGQFKKGTSPILNFGISASAFWIQLAFKPSGRSSDYLVIDAATIEEIDCYIPVDKQWKCVKSGALAEDNDGVRSTNQYIFEIPASLNGPEVKTVWVRLKARNVMIVPVKLVNNENLFRIENPRLRVIEFGLIGVLFTFFAFNLFLYFGFKDRIYLYYCIYTLSFGMYVIGYFAGYGYLLGTSFRIFLNQYPHVYFCFGSIAALLITNRFCRLRELSRPLYNVYRFLIVLSVVQLAISLVGLKSWAASAAQIIGLLLPLTLVLCAIALYRSRRQTVTYFILAWTLIMIAIIYYVLSLAGFFAYNAYSRLILEVSAILEFLFLALALAQRYYTLQQQQQQAEQEKYQIIKYQNIELEKLVAKRTDRLKETITKLEASDNIKNKLFSIIAHDLRTPFNSMLGILASDNLEMLSFEELKTVLRKNENSFLQLKTLLDNLLHWAHMQMRRVEIRPEAFDLNKVIGDLVSVYRPVALKKQLSLETALPLQMDFVYADKNQVQLILRNLIDNAIKFTRAPHIIQVMVDPREDHALISVKNGVEHLSKDGLETWMNKPSFKSNYGTANEKGVGLGLNLCREYLEKNNSKLQLEIENNTICFAFKLPFASCR